jgi:hypothetical protein
LHPYEGAYIMRWVEDCGYKVDFMKDLVDISFSWLVRRLLGLSDCEVDWT